MTYLQSRRNFLTAISGASAGTLLFSPVCNLSGEEKPKYDDLSVKSYDILALKADEKAIKAQSELAYETRLANFHRDYPNLLFKNGKTFPRGNWVKEDGFWKTWDKNANAGVWQQTEIVTRQECTSNGCRWIKVPVRKEYTVQGGGSKSSKNKSNLDVRYPIPTPRMYWVYYGGNYGIPLRRHISSTHYVNILKLSSLSTNDLRKIHSLAHNGNLDQYWYV